MIFLVQCLPCFFFAYSLCLSKYIFYLKYNERNLHNNFMSFLQLRKRLIVLTCYNTPDKINLDYIFCAVQSAFYIIYVIFPKHYLFILHIYHMRRIVTF